MYLERMVGMLHIPFCNEKGSQNDIFSRLMEDRIVMIFDVIDENSAQLAISQLLYLDSIDHEKPIMVYINSPGGSVVDGLAIIDTFELIQAPVTTVCVGMAASMGAVILSCGDNRYMTKNSECMVHQVLGGTGYAQCSDIQITAENILKTNQRLMRILADNSFLTVEEMTEICDRDHYMTAEETLEIGLIDGILKPKKKQSK